MCPAANRRTETCRSCPRSTIADKVPHVLAKFNTGTGRPLIDFHEALLRGDSPFTIPEREFMAAYISGVNACQSCQGAHTAAAKQFGVAGHVISDALRDPDNGRGQTRAASRS